MARHNKIDHLSQQEIAAFMTNATALHETLVRPRIAVSCEHYKATRRLHEALINGIQEITGDDPPWMKIPASHMTVAFMPPK